MEQAFGLSMPHWEASLEMVFEEMKFEKKP